MKWWKPFLLSLIFGVTSSAQPPAPVAIMLPQQAAGTPSAAQPQPAIAIGQQITPPGNPGAQPPEKRSVAAAAPAAQPAMIPVIQLPGIVQPASGQGMSFRVVVVPVPAPVAQPAPAGKKALASVPNKPAVAANPDVKRGLIPQAYSAIHLLFDIFLIALCIGTIWALIHLNNNRRVMPRASTMKLSSAFELLPTGTYGSLKSEAAIL